MAKAYGIALKAAGMKGPGLRATFTVKEHFIGRMEEFVKVVGKKATSTALGKKYILMAL